MLTLIFLGYMIGDLVNTKSAKPITACPKYYFSYMYATSNASGFSSGMFDGLREELSISEIGSVKNSLMKQNSNYVNVEIMFIRDVKGK